MNDIPETGESFESESFITSKENAGENLSSDDPFDNFELAMAIKQQEEKKQGLDEAKVRELVEPLIEGAVAKLKVEVERRFEGTERLKQALAQIDERIAAVDDRRTRLSEELRLQITSNKADLKEDLRKLDHELKYELGLTTASVEQERVQMTKLRVNIKN